MNVEAAVAEARQHRIEAIQAGFPPGHTYDPELCALDPDARRLADRYERMAFDPEQRYKFRPPMWVFDVFKRWMEAQIKEMERDVQIILYQPDPKLGHDQEEPYLTSEAMCRDVRDHKRLYVRRRKAGAFAGHLTQPWRTYHDLRGHCACDAPFTLSGELRAYTQHCQHWLTKVPDCVRPFAWNNVYLENDFRLNRTHFLCKALQCGSTIIFDEEEFGPQQDYWRSLLPY